MSATRSAVALALFLVLWCVPFTLGQLAGTPPACALSCVETANIPGCGTADERCLCTTPAATAAVKSCIQQHCTQSADLNQAMGFIQDQCESLTGAPSGTETPAATSTISAASEQTGASFGDSAALSLPCPSLMGLVMASLMGFLPRILLA